MIALLLGALLAQAVEAPASQPPVPPGAAVIANSGSTNAAGFTVVVTPDGAATVRQYDGSKQKVVGAPQTRWLFALLQAAGPLDALGLAHCMKSASFGTSTRIAWNDRTSGDLSCGGDATSRELARTIGVIVRQLDIVTMPRSRRLRTL